ncbi:hypothetical protein GIB67_001138 [Kingdonia uniflora]|uniref:WW domain-containing protein n=1 Tax=Kingdonia uniflora TaxID=39325 RepID=A0A7J7N486_9MAGN|nr:hypothetical protein GIB67_001138 [Kingdonia uniflora]
MDQPELSLGPSNSSLGVSENNMNTSSCTESESNVSKKRKHNWDHSFKTDQPMFQLQLKDPLPLDWEQCLDLESGDMYYLNKNTLKKSWNRPKNQKLDLELNMSTNLTFEGSELQNYSSSSSSNSTNMVAVACFKCHLLVMLCRSSPSCPNCKYMHSLLPEPSPPPPKKSNIKTLNTLNLLT